MKLPCPLDNQMSSPYEYDHQVCPAIPVRPPAQPEKKEKKDGTVICLEEGKQ